MSTLSFISPLLLIDPAALPTPVSTLGEVRFNVPAFAE